MLRLSDFDYILPKELIAQYPLEERDRARLLVLNRGKRKIEHRLFKDVVDYLSRDDLLVLNDTKVLTCRFLGRRQTTGRVEVLLLNHKGGRTFNALIKPARVRVNDEISFNNGSLRGKITSKNELTFLTQDLTRIYNYGQMPLPPYIKRLPSNLDNEYYQTVYAKNKGAIAAPTAGLHFTKELLEDIKSSGIDIAYLTLHVGLGTFQLIKSEDIRKHKMQEEYFQISQEALGLIEKRRLSRGHIFAVGTTSLRALETFASEGKAEGKTDLFIYPGYKFKMVDCLLTNFHLPRTTLFMLVCAFATEKLIKQAYQEAVNKKYRFYSYGDAMLII